MKIHDVTQGTAEWLALRAGIPTASEFDNLITPLWKTRTGEGPESYLFRKIAEKCMGIPLQQGGSWAMEQGSILETEALPWVSFMHDVKIDKVGFITTDDGRIGCSPDGLIGEDGGIEAKCPQPDTHLKYLVHGVVPKDYLAQVHGSMLVTGRAWWYFLSYSRQFPPLLIKVQRDEDVMKAMRGALDEFLERFDLTYAKLKGDKDAENARKTAEYYAKEGVKP